MRQQLDVGAVIGKVWRIYVDQAPVLMPAAAAVFVLGVLAAPLGALAAAVLYFDLRATSGEAAPTTPSVPAGPPLAS